MAARAAAAAAVLLGTLSGCSAPEETGAPPATSDERRALADAEAMIPAAEATPAPPAEETPTP